MVGWMAYNNLWELKKIDKILFGGEEPKLSRKDVILKYGEYLEHIKHVDPKINFQAYIKPLLSICAFTKINKVFRK